MKQSIQIKLENLCERYDEIAALLSEPEIQGNQNKFRTLSQEYAQISPLVDCYKRYEQALNMLRSAKEMANDTDPELREMAKEEVIEAEDLIESMDHELQILLLPKDPNDDNNIFLEVRAGTGGDEAALFAGELFRMYCRYADSLGLKVEELESSPADLGGLREVIFRISGTSVFRRFRYESGVHRVQRVPATEAQGRIHTSTATVAVLPEAEEVDIEIKPEDLRIEVCRAGGPGGQGVNTTDSAVQVMHIPTGRIVRCQDGRSQQKNKEAAIKIMRSRLLEDKRREEEEKYSAHRRSLIGGGGREEKIRTYNFAENRVTDHRIKLSLYSLDRFLDGDIGGLVEALQISDIEQRLKDSGIA